MVRNLLDELEEAAPWENLYYPPEEAAALIAMEASLLRVIESADARAEALEESLEDAPSEQSAQRLCAEVRYFFGVIHASVEPEIANLKSRLEALGGASGTVALAPEERDSQCELAADLKGKYSSSLMGVAARLVLADLGGGSAAESILFAERAEELERNRLLVETLTEVIENITSLLREVPVAELVEQWRRGQRVDLYALTPLYQLLGNLGKLMQEKSRRAIYSGDYHQIRKRERLLEARINELSTLHNLAWEADSTATRLDSSHFALMVERATELAAILDLNILKAIVGERNVDRLLAAVASKEASAAAAAEGRPSALLASVPQHLRPLIPLLETEDLQTFLGLLLGSVLKRASLARDREALENLAPAAPGADPPTPRRNQRLGELREMLETLRSRSNVHRMSFALVYRLLKQGKAIPREMVQSMLPYVDDVRELLPVLRDPEQPAGVAARYATDLQEGCAFLCDTALTSEQLRHQASGFMEKMLRQLDELDAAVRTAAQLGRSSSSV